MEVSEFYVIMRAKVEKERYQSGLNKVVCDQDCDVGSLLLCVDVWLEWSDVVSPTGAYHHRPCLHWPWEQLIMNYSQAAGKLDNNQLYIFLLQSGPGTCPPRVVNTRNTNCRNIPATAVLVDVSL